MCEKQHHLHNNVLGNLFGDYNHFSSPVVYPKSDAYPCNNREKCSKDPVIIIKPFPRPQDMNIIKSPYKHRNTHIYLSCMSALRETYTKLQMNKATKHASNRYYQGPIHAESSIQHYVTSQTRAESVEDKSNTLFFNSFKVSKPSIIIQARETSYYINIPN